MELVDIDQSVDNVTILIKEKLQKLPPIVPERSIYRVTKHLWEMNRKAYEPQVISIGPFHRHDEQKFKVTEELKHRFFNSYRCRNNLSVRVIVEKVRGWERIARKYYSETINMKNEEFMEMMVVDGCFIVELLIKDRKDLFSKNENEVESSFYKAIHCDIVVDLIMLENQLPFFVLQGLFDLVSPMQPDNDNIEQFERIVHSFLNSQLLLNKSRTLAYTKPNQRPHHLLDLLSCYFISLDDQTNVAQEDSNYLPPSATQLHEAGVIFKKVEGNQPCLVNISFKDGILKIPPLVIDDKFEAYARNLLAFAQFSSTKHVIDYFEFLDELINTKKDVSLLAKEGIILNHIGGGDIEISKLFNDLCKNINLPSINYFSNISKELKHHCKRRRNTWMTSLRHNYFNTPWALISFLAATFIILLTLLQTIFSAMSTFE